MSLRIDNGERATLEYADIALSPTRYIASWLRQRGWRLPDYRQRLSTSSGISQGTSGSSHRAKQRHSASHSLCYKC